MMQRYLDIGKEYLSKKIEQFSSSNNQSDFITEQIPLKLRQPLAVLQQQQIDIEDAHVYENYYKNYPNHHISSFLLDKFNMMVEAEAEPNKYVAPEGENSQVLNFDTKLENKALLLRQAIQQYDEGFFKTEDPIVCLAVINFHHKRGTQVEYRYPQNKDVESLEHMIVHHAMPDSSHNKPEDYNFFNFEAEYRGKKRMLFGVSYFKQIKLTEQMKKQNAEFTRSYLQKAVAIVSVVPLFGYLKVKLSFTTKFFFVKFTSFTIIQQAYKEINKHLAEAWPNIPITDLNIGTDLRSILQLFDVSDFYEIWKAVLYHKKIVVFGHSSSSVSSFILSLLSLFPGQNTFGIFSRPIAKYMQSLRELALPLRIFSSQNFLSMSFHIQDFELLNKFKKSKKGNFLIGTTNRLLKQSNDFGIQLLVNLENCTIEKRNPRRSWQSLNTKEKNFIAELSEIASKQRGLTYDTSQDSIRDHFHSFLKGVLVQLIVSMKAFQRFSKDCIKFAQQNLQNSNQQKPQNAAQFFPPLLPQQVKKMTLPQLLLHKSFAYFRQFKNENFPQIVKGKLIPSLYINNYDYYLRLNSEDFIVYNWLDKKLSFGKGSNTKNFQGKQIRFKTTKDQDKNQQTKSIYVGNVLNGKYDKNGFYVDSFQRYEGEYSSGIKQGYGKLIVGNQKYIGDFSNNVYEGRGQLIIGNDVYVGSFKNGVKNGYGTMQGSFEFDGYWENGKPTLSMKEIKAKQLHQKNYVNVEEGQQELPIQVPPPKSQFSVKLEKKVEKIIRQIQSKTEEQNNISAQNDKEVKQSKQIKEVKEIKEKKESKIQSTQTKNSSQQKQKVQNQPSKQQELTNQQPKKEQNIKEGTHQQKKQTNQQNVEFKAENEANDVKKQTQGNIEVGDEIQ